MTTYNVGYFVADVPKPSPGPGQVLVEIGGAGVCHSDLHVMEEDLGVKPRGAAAVASSRWRTTARTGQRLNDVGTDFNARVLKYFERRSELEKGLPPQVVTDDSAHIRKAGGLRRIQQPSLI